MFSSNVLDLTLYIYEVNTVKNTSGQQNKCILFSVQQIYDNSKMDYSCVSDSSVTFVSILAEVISGKLVH